MVIDHIIWKPDEPYQLHITSQPKNWVSYLASANSLRISMVMMAKLDLELCQLDVKTTSLNGKLKGEIIVEQPRFLKPKTVR